MTVLSDYNESVSGSLCYRSVGFINSNNNGTFVEVQLTMISVLIAKIRYFYDLDILVIGDYQRNVHHINDFSTITTPEQYFQQSTIQDCSSFDYEDVEPFLKNIRDIINEKT